MKEIVLQKGEVALVSDEDFERINGFSWYEHEGYAEQRIDGKLWKMHRFIVDPPQDLVVHHEDRNRLNNQRANLTIMSNSDHIKLHWSEYTQEQKDVFCTYMRRRKTYLTEDYYYAEDLERQAALYEYFY